MNASTKHSFGAVSLVLLGTMLWGPACRADWTVTFFLTTPAKRDEALIKILAAHELNPFDPNLSVAENEPVPNYRIYRIAHPRTCTSDGNCKVLILNTKEGKLERCFMASAFVENRISRDNNEYVFLKSRQTELSGEGSVVHFIGGAIRSDGKAQSQC